MKNEKDFEERQKRSQAELISCWKADEVGDQIWIAVCNNSSLPIYSVIINLEFITQTGESFGDQVIYPICVSVVSPGIGYIYLEAQYHGMNRRVGVEMGFKDSIGNNWTRRSDGVLIQIDEPTLAYFHIAIPADWRELLSASSSEKIKADYLQTLNLSK